MPQAILLQDHETLGDRGTVVDVSKGYLRNYLIPRKLAEPATKGSIAAAERRRQAADRALAEVTTKARDNAELLNKTVLTITHQAGDDGRLFGSVTSQDIVDAIREARGIRIDRRKVHLRPPPRAPRHPHRPPQAPPRRADPHGRHAHGRRRGCRRRHRDHQDDGRRREVAPRLPPRAATRRAAAPRFATTLR